MKSKSRLPKFSELPVSGPIVQTDPRVWKPRLHGFPCWFKPMGDLVLKPFYTPHAVAEAAHQGCELPQFMPMNAFKIKELRARTNPWHPAGRLEQLVVEGGGMQLTLRFSLEDQVQCTSVSKIYAAPAAAPQRDSKYKGPRLAGDTKSAVSGNKRKP